MHKNWNRTTVVISPSPEDYSEYVFFLHFKTRTVDKNRRVG